MVINFISVIMTYLSHINFLMCQGLPLQCLIDLTEGLFPTLYASEADFYKQNYIFSVIRKFHNRIFISISSRKGYIPILNASLSAL